MRRLARTVGVCLLLLPWSCMLGPPVRAGEPPVVRLVTFDGTVHPISKLRITRAIDDAEAAGDELVLIELDTPGGLVSSMETIVQRMLSSKVPIAVWVGPPGAHAASAGFFILIASDVAAMAPGTRTGAASGVLAGGENREGDILLKKVNEDLAALIRSIAARRGRDVEACEQAVLEARAFEEQLALERGLIDMVVPDRESLLAELEGREVTMFDGSTRQLHLAGATFVETRFNLRHRFMELLGHPEVAAVLLMLGLLGIYVEITHPGVVFPGLAGALCLLLFVLAAQVLPVSVAGLLLILLAVVMFILEIKVVSYGMLTLGGIASFTLGAWMLFDGPVEALRLSPSISLPLSLTFGAVCALAMWLAAQAQRLPVATGVEGLVSEVGRVTRALAPDGKVFVHGELWDATSASGPVAEGSAVRVVRVDGMRLYVEPANDAASEGG